MRLDRYCVACLAASAVLAGCWQTEVERSEETRESAPDEVETAMSEETRQIIEAAEERIRTGYEEQGMSVVSIDMGVNDNGDYVGEAVVMVDGERVPLSCEGMGVPGGFEDLTCTDTRGPASRTNVDVLLRQTGEAEIREEIVSEMRYALAGAGRTSELSSIDFDGDTVTALFDTRYETDGRTVESRCSGDLRELDDGRHAIAFSCRRPL